MKLIKSLGITGVLIQILMVLGSCGRSTHQVGSSQASFDDDRVESKLKVVFRNGRGDAIEIAVQAPNYVFSSLNFPTGARLTYYRYHSKRPTSTNEENGINNPKNFKDIQELLDGKLGFYHLKVVLPETRLDYERHYEWRGAIMESPFQSLEPKNAPKRLIAFPCLDDLPATKDNICPGKGPTKVPGNEVSPVEKKCKDQLAPGEELKPGNSLCSGNNRAVFQEDGNFVIYADRGKQSRVVWYSGNPRQAVRLQMQPDCNLVAYDSNNAFTWNSKTANITNNCHLVFDGVELKIRSPEKQIIWTSITDQSPMEAGASIEHKPYELAVPYTPKVTLKFRNAVSDFSHKKNYKFEFEYAGPNPLRSSGQYNYSYGVRFTDGVQKYRFERSWTERSDKIGYRPQCDVMFVERGNAKDIANIPDRIELGHVGLSIAESSIDSSLISDREVFTRAYFRTNANWTLVCKKAFHSQETAHVLSYLDLKNAFVNKDQVIADLVFENR